MILLQYDPDFTRVFTGGKPAEIGIQSALHFARIKGGAPRKKGILQIRDFDSHFLKIRQRFTDCLDKFIAEFLLTLGM